MSCKVGALLEDGSPLNADDKATLAGALGNAETVPASQLAKALTAHGVKVGSTTIKDHRATRCAC